MRWKASVRAFTLVEVVLALGIASFCLLVLMGLLPTGLSVQNASTKETSAVNVATAVIEDLQAVAALQATSTNSLSPRYSLTLPSSGAGEQELLYLDDGGAPTTNTAAATFAVVVTLLGDTAVTRTHLLVAWPAQIAAKFSTNSTYLPGNGATDLRTQFQSAAGPSSGSIDVVATISRQ